MTSFFRQRARRKIAIMRAAKQAVISGDGSAIAMRADVRGEGRRRIADVGGMGSFYSPAERIAKALGEALDPSKAPGPVRTMADMSPEEIATLRARYETRTA